VHVDKLTKKKLIWYVTKRGFGSEMLLLLMGIVYAEQKNMEFILVSKYSNYFLKKGWRSLFSSFIKESFYPAPKFNLWPVTLKQKMSNLFFSIKNKFYHGILAKSNIDCFEIIWNKEFEDNRFSSKKFAYQNVNLVEAVSKILDNIWVLSRQDFLNGFEFVTKDKNISNYLCVHIRAGDKVSGKTKEADPVDFDNLLSMIYSLPLKFDNIIVITDDYNSFLNFTSICRQFCLKTTCPDTHFGYFNSSFLVKTPDQTFLETQRLIGDIEIAVGALYFIGPYSSNLSRLIYLLRKGKNCFNYEGYPFSLIY
jgi:hypothetical protein